MLAAIQYRGPDHLEARAYSLNEDFHITVGQVRLAILDPSPEANQPFELGDHSITFNGEFYNFRDLRHELEKQGAAFRTTSDTEVALTLLAQQGISALDQLHGMFAGVYVDRKHGRVHLFRDRLGKKPLYLYQQGDEFLFASEPRAILAVINSYPAIDALSLSQYFMLSYIPGGSIFKGMTQLAPGHRLECQSPSDRKTQRWYHPNPVTNPNEEDLEPLFMDAVAKRMISDVPLGAFLSGGLDSSLVVAAMSRLSSKKVHSFSVRFAGPQAFDESVFARQLASHCNTQHDEITLDPQRLCHLVPQVLDHFDEPFGDSSAVPSYLVAREARRHFTVALSGDGADEVFAGYRKYLGESYLKRLGPYWLRRRLLKPLVKFLPSGRTNKLLENARRIKRLLDGDAATAAERHVRWLHMSPIDYASLLDPVLAHHRPDIVAGLVEKLPKHALLNDRLKFDQDIVLVNDMFVKIDRMSMKASLELRSPLVDHRLVEFANGLPANRKLMGSHRKRILVERLGHMLPSSILKRPKSGFEMPIGAWLRSDLKSWAEKELFDHTETGEWVNRTALKEIWQSHQSGRHDMTEPIWYHLVFAHWLGRYQSRKLHLMPESDHV